RHSRQFASIHLPNLCNAPTKDVECVEYLSYAGLLLLSPSYGESGRREEPCNTSAPLGYPRGVMPVHVDQHPLVEDVLARRQDDAVRGVPPAHPPGGAAPRG